MDVKLINYDHFLQGDLRSGVISKFLMIWRILVGVLFKFITFLADTDLDLDRLFSLSFKSIKMCLGVLLSFSSRPLFLGLTLSLSSGCKKASSQLMRSSSLFFKHLRMKSLEVSETEGSKMMGLVLMLLISWSSLLAGHGVIPCSSS